MPQMYCVSPFIFRELVSSFACFWRLILSISLPWFPLVSTTLIDTSYHRQCVCVYPSSQSSFETLPALIPHSCYSKLPLMEQYTREMYSLTVLKALSPKSGPHSSWRLWEELHFTSLRFWWFLVSLGLWQSNQVWSQITPTVSDSTSHGLHPCKYVLFLFKGIWSL